MITRADIAVGGLSVGFVALCIGITSGMNGSLIAFATTIAALLGGALTARYGVDAAMRWFLTGKVK